ncbi:hypothetical protein CHELA20_51635 [Hyphomicrobiales bacterium]|nr:hypothetical protein CHELA41_23377 [Hyphomicrobiales bacterium]CAH1677434.1 hypothetical protein CHELA20_51635 [Hyphomicrobiales bacterium]
MDRIRAFRVRCPKCRGAEDFNGFMILDVVRLIHSHDCVFWVRCDFLSISGAHQYQ